MFSLVFFVCNIVRVMCVFVHNSALIVVAENSTQHFHFFSLGRQFGKIIKMYIYLLDLTSSSYIYNNVSLFFPPISSKQKLLLFIIITTY